MTLTGVSRFTIREELDVDTPYRQVVADFHPYAVDLVSDTWCRRGEPPRPAQGLPRLSQCHDMKADWDQVDAASTEVLVNTLSLLAPYPPD